MVHQVPRIRLTAHAVAGQLERRVRPAAWVQRTGRTREGVWRGRLESCVRCAGNKDEWLEVSGSVRSMLRRWLPKKRRTRSEALNSGAQRRLAREGASGRGEPPAASRAEDNRHCFPAGLTFELTWRRRRDAKPAPQIMHTCTVARALWHAVGSQVERGVRHRFSPVERRKLLGQLCRLGSKA